MALEAIGTIIALLGLLGTIAGLVFALGKRDARLDALESRCREEWGRNGEQHKDFYATADTAIKLQAVVEGITASLTEIKGDLKDILRRITGAGV